MLKKLLAFVGIFSFLIAVSPAQSASFKKARTVGPEEFMYLCGSGSAQDVANAIKSGASVWIQYNDGTTTLMKAASSNTQAVVDILVKAGVDVNAKNAEGNSALLFAARFNNNLDVIDTLIEAGAEDTSNKEGKTALMLAAEYNTPNVVRALIKAGADLNAKSQNGETALGIAKRRRNFEVVNAFFNFYEVCESGSVEDITRAIQAGANVNQPDEFGMTPLIYASISNTPQAVQTLLKAGAQVNQTNALGMTPLMLAADSNTPQVVQTLIKAGADINMMDDEHGYTSLMYAVGNTPEVVEVLLDANPDTLLDNIEGETAIEMASYNPKMKDTETFKRLKSVFTAQNKPEYQYKIGMEYYKANNINDATKWLDRSAEQNYRPAQTQLANYAYKEFETFHRIMSNRDLEFFLKWNKRLAEQGDVESCFRLRNYFRKSDSEQSTYWLKKAADQGNAEAQYQLSVAYHVIDIYGYEYYDYEVLKIGLENLIKAAKQGHEKAIQSLREWAEWAGIDESNDDKDKVRKLLKILKQEKIVK